MIGALLDVLYPPRCLGCGGEAWPFCHVCWEGIAVLMPPGCRRCGRPLPLDAPSCPDCPPAAVAWCRAPFLYRGPVRAALMRIKFGGLRSAAEGLGPWMAWMLAHSPPPSSGVPGPPTLTWVPLGARRRRVRGFDQAQALARQVGRLTGWPVRRSLERVVETTPQARRAGAERRDALRGAFRAVAPPPPAIVLVDDVVTSGATVAECATVLREAGAQEVGVLSAARSLGRALPARCYNPPVFRPGSVVARERSFR